MLDYAGQNRYATKWLLEYPERRLDFLDRMGEFSTLSATKLTGMPMGTDVGRPVENLGLSLVRLEETRLWLATIEDTEKILGEKKLAFLNARRWVHKQQQYAGAVDKGRPGWVSGTQARYTDWFYRRYGCVSYPDPKTLTRWWDEIVNIAVRIAIARGCTFQE